MTGLGADIVEIKRVARLLNKYPRRFVGRVLSAEERRAFAGRAAKTKAAFVAKRFAAKEALGKALGIGLRTPLLLSAIGVANDAKSGAPGFVADARLRRFLRERGVVNCRLSLSDDGGLALAVVALEFSKARR
jgi:holo-[acyl-carrier protein] synthase